MNDISEAEDIRSANNIMGFNQDNNLGNEYKKIDRFIIDQDGNFPAKNGSPFKLFKKEDQVFFSIIDSPLKEIYIIKTWINGQKTHFLVFENLRGHIKNDNFIEKLKNKILKKIPLKSFPVKIMDQSNYEKTYHIKIPLKEDEIKNS